MGDLSDQTLMAYVDGILNEADRAKVEEILASDVSAQQRLSALVKTSNLLREAYREPMNQPVPEHLVRLVKMRAESTATQHVKAHKTKLAGNGAVSSLISGFFEILPMRQWIAFGGMGALAAAIVLAILTFEPTMVPGIPQNPSMPTIGVAANGDGKVWATGSFRDFLETARSKQAYSWREEDQTDFGAKVLVTFQNSDRQYCRQYALNIAQTQRFDGVACRTAMGKWRVRWHRGKTLVAKGVRPEGQGPVDGHVPPEVKKLVDELRVGGTIGVEDELRLLANDWQTL